MSYTFKSPRIHMIENDIENNIPITPLTPAINDRNKRTSENAEVVIDIDIEHISLLGAKYNAPLDVNNLLEFKCKKIQTSYENYLINDVDQSLSYNLNGFFSLFVFCVINIITLCNTVSESFKQNNVNTLLFISYAIRTFTIFPIGFMFIRTWSLKFENKFHAFMPSHKKMANWVLLLQTLFTGFAFVMKCSSGRCPLSDVTCGSSLTVNTNAATLLIILFFIVVFVAKHCSWWVVLFCWFINLGFLIAGSLIVENHYSAVAFFYLHFQLLFWLHAMEIRKLRMFTTLVFLDKSIREKLHAENEEKNGRKMALELSQLIGNVAHDLKTPMQGFSSGLESLKSLVISLLTLSNSLQTKTEITTQDKIDESLDVITLLQSTCTFMNMAINRSLDFRFVNNHTHISPLN